MQLKRNISQVVKDLIDSGDLSEPNQLSHLNFNQFDAYPTFRKLFTDEAANILHNNTQGMIYQYNEFNPRYGVINTLSKLNVRPAEKLINTYVCGQYVRKMSRINYFGLACDESNMSEAVSKIIDAVNDMAANKQINGALTPLSIIRMHESTPPESRLVVVSYVAVPMDVEPAVNAKYKDLLFSEGGMPNNIKDIK